MKRNKLLENIERVVIVFAGLLFILHALVIILAQVNIIPIEFFKEQSLLESVATPFTIILIFEIVLLLLAIRSPLNISVAKQYQIAILILIRDILKVLTGLDINGTLSGQIDILGTIGIDLLLSIVALGLLALYIKTSKKADGIVEDSTLITQIKWIRKLMSGVLLVAYAGVLIFFILNLIQSGSWESFFEIFKSLNIFVTIFVFAILSDVIILLATFYYRHSINIIFYESLLIISTILVRLSFLSESPFIGIITITSITFAVLTNLVITYLHENNIDYEPAHEL